VLGVILRVNAIIAVVLIAPLAVIPLVVATFFTNTSLAADSRTLRNIQEVRSTVHISTVSTKGTFE
jgi:hypothetical protein